MYRAILFLLAIVLIMSIGCNDDDPSTSSGQASGDDDDTVDDDDDDDSGDDDDNDDEAPEEYDYDVPVKSTSPWPMHRRTSRNTGRSPVMPVPSEMDVWSFSMEKGMFHEPVIDEDGTVYMGSADTFIYAINSDGTEKWRFATGEINDSTAIIAADGTIFVPSGDGYIYALTAGGEEKWRFQAEMAEGFIPWWEGHITMGPDGTLYAGNDDRRLYAISQEGEKLWTYKTYDQVWSCPAVGADGELYFGANDFLVRSVRPDGAQRWLSVTLGPVSGSTALYDNGATVLAVSFDGYVHAYNTEDGAERWAFPVRDHIYASPAIAEDGTIYVGSADGAEYAINPDGTLKWAFDTLDPIRSSAALDGEGNIYFGCGDGQVYCLGPDGARKWSFDTSTSDRNDLNGSPALGTEGVYIGGEAGELFFIPFGYCENSKDERCDLSPGEDIPDDGSFLYYYTSGGSSTAGIEINPTPTEVLTFRLVVREGGDTIRARIKSDDLNVDVTPAFAHRIEVSADGNFFSVIPQEDLAMGADYTVEMEGSFLTGGSRIGNRVFGGTVGGSFEGEFSFTTAAATGSELPLAVDGNEADVLLFRRISVPQPPMLTTFNQIGFDSYNYLIGTVATDPANDRFVMVGVQGTPGLTPSIDVDTKSIFALNGAYTDSYFTMTSEGLTLDVTGVSILMDWFRISGLLHPDLTSNELNAYTEVTCSNIEFFGFALNLLGLCNPDSGKMIANGVARFDLKTGDEGTKPAGLTVDAINVAATGGMYGGGFVEALFDANTLPASEHLPILMLVDKTTYQAAELAYGESLEKTADGSGHLGSVRLHLPGGFDLDGLTVYVIVNLYPIYQEAL